MPYKYAKFVLEARALWAKKPRPLKIDTAQHGRAKIVHQKTIYEKGKAKGVIARLKHAVSHPNAETVTLFYYPRPEHIPAFGAAARYTTPGSPGQHYPGSVGSIEFIQRRRQGKTEIMIDYMQAHFKTIEKGKAAELASSARLTQGALPRSLATEYGGWRTRVLQEIFGRAKSKKAEVILSDYDPKRWPSKEKSINARLKVFTEVAEKNGYVVETKINEHYGMPNREFEARAVLKK